MRRHVFIKESLRGEQERFTQNKKAYVNRLGLHFVFAQYLSEITHKCTLANIADSDSPVYPIPVRRVNPA